MVVNNKGCSATIFGERVHSWQCQKKPVVTRDGKLYCKIHDPEYVAEKHRKWQEKYDKEMVANRAKWDLKQARSDATEGLTLEELRRVTPELIRKALGLSTHKEK